MRSPRWRAILLAGCVLVVIGLFLWFGEKGAVAPGIVAPQNSLGDRTELTREAVPQHSANLKSPDRAVRKEAASFLWKIGAAGSEAIPSLQEATRDPDPEVRTTAAK